jgi:hypothetical protein
MKGIPETCTKFDIYVFISYIMALSLKITFFISKEEMGISMEIGWTDVGSGGYILVSCARSNTIFFYISNDNKLKKLQCI